MLRLLSTLILPVSPLASRELPIRTYTVSDGLSDDRVKRLKVDSHGLLWMCTSAGLSRFDGAQFQNFGPAEGLPYPSINDLLESANGDFWLASNGGGVIRFSNSAGRAHRAFPVSSEGGSNRVNRLYQAPDGAIWLGTDGGLFRMTTGPHGLPAFQRVNLHLPGHPDETVQVWAFAGDSEGGLWIGTRFGLFRILPGNRTVHYPLRDDLEVDNVSFLLYTPEDNLLWIGHRSGLALLKPSKSSTYAAAPASDTAIEDPSLATAVAASRQSILDEHPALPQQPGDASFLSTSAMGAFPQVVDVVPAISGGMRIVVGGGVFEYSGGRLSRLQDERFRRPLLAAATDREGNLWVGTQGLGVLRLASRGFVTYRDSDGIGQMVGPVFEDRAGELIAVSQDWRISRLDGAAFHTVQLNVPAAARSAGFRGDQNVLQDRTGDWWVATGAGLARYQHVRAIDDLARVEPRLYTARDGLAQNAIQQLFEDSRGDIWIAGLAPSREILTRWERTTGRFIRYSDRDGLVPFNAARGFFEDHRGRLWIAFREGGMARYENGRFTLLTEADGLPPGPIVHAMLDRAGRIWCAMDRAGVFRIDNLDAVPLRAVAVIPQSALRGATVGHIVEYGVDQMFALTSQGVLRIDNAGANPQIGGIFTASDGLASTEPLGAYADREGRLWFATIQGLSYCRQMPPVNVPSPETRIGGIRIGGVETPVSPAGAPSVELPDLPPGASALEIDFFGIHFASGGPLAFEHRLLGADPAWRRAGPVRSVLFSHLAPGSYRFEVRAVSGGEVAVSPVASAVFRVLPPVWRRWWFVSLVALYMLSALGAFECYRAARVREVRLALAESRRLGVKLGEVNRTLALEAVVTRIIAEAETPAEAAPRMIEEICAATGWNSGAIWEYDREAHTLHSLTGEPDSAEEAALASPVLATGEPHWVERLPGAPLRSGLAFPVLIGRQVVAIAAFYGEGARPADDAQIRSLSSLGSHIGNLVEAARARRIREERLAELEGVRRGIAADLHDEIGSSLTEISILSEVARTGTLDGDPLSSIATLAREIVESMSDIVWAVNPARDHLSDLTQRMRRFAINTLSASNTEFRLDLPPADRDLKLGANLRREVFLIFKEGINNMVKHSGCTEAVVRLTVLPKRLHLRIQDNGRGFDPASTTDGHGLASLRRRAQALHGRLEIESSPGSGASLTLEVPV